MKEWIEGKLNIACLDCGKILETEQASIRGSDKATIFSCCEDCIKKKIKKEGLVTNLSWSIFHFFNKTHFLP